MTEYQKYYTDLEAKLSEVLDNSTTENLQELAAIFKISYKQFKELKAYSFTKPEALQNWQDYEIYMTKLLEQAIQQLRQARQETGVKFFEDWAQSSLIGSFDGVSFLPDTHDKAYLSMALCNELINNLPEGYYNIIGLQIDKRHINLCLSALESPELFNENELKILNSKDNELNLSDLDLQIVGNHNLLELAVLNEQLDLAAELIEHDPTLMERSSDQEFNFVEIITSGAIYEITPKLCAAIIAQYPDLDIAGTAFNTLADALMANSLVDQENKALILTKSAQYQALYSLTNPEYATSQDIFADGKAHILVAHDEGNHTFAHFTFKQILARNDNIVCYHIDYKTWNDMPDSMKERFDGFVLNAEFDDADNKLLFSKEKLNDEGSAMAKLTLSMLDFAHEKSIPTLAINNGADMDILLSNGELVLEAFDINQEYGLVKVPSGTTEYFMSLNKESQKRIMAGEKLGLTEIEYRVWMDESYSNAHSVKIDTVKEPLHIGGVAYSTYAKKYLPIMYSNGPVLSTQFTPDVALLVDSLVNEVKYFDENSWQINWFNSFLNLAQIHHDHMIDPSSPSVDEYLLEVKSKMFEAFGQEPDLVSYIENLAPAESDIGQDITDHDQVEQSGAKLSCDIIDQDNCSSAELIGEEGM